MKHKEKVMAIKIVTFPTTADKNLERKSPSILEREIKVIGLEKHIIPKDLFHRKNL